MTLREEVLKNSGVLSETILLTKPGELHVKFWNYDFLVKNAGKTYTCCARPDNKELYNYIISAASILDYNWKHIDNPLGENKVTAIIMPEHGGAKQEETVFTGEQAKSIIDHILALRKKSLINFIDNNTDKFTADEKEYLDKAKKYLIGR